MKTLISKLTFFLLKLFTAFLPSNPNITVFNNFAYKVQNNEINIIDFENTSATSIVIPREINGHSVTSIGEYAFSSCQSLMHITLPDTITTIESSAFSGCSILESVHITNLAAYLNCNYCDAYSNPIYYADKLKKYNFGKQYQNHWQRSFLLLLKTKKYNHTR